MCLANQFRSSLRFLAKHRISTTINVLGMSLGLCTCVAIYNIVSFEFSYDSAVPHKDRIYRVGCSIQLPSGNGAVSESYGRFIPAPAPDVIRKKLPSVETLAAYYNYPVTVTVPAAGIQLSANNATVIAGENYFDIFPYQWLAGSPAESLTQPNSVVLTSSRAREYFGAMPAASYLNRELVYDDSLRVRVSGIVQDYQGNTDFRFTDFISFPTINYSFLKRIYTKDRWSFNLGSPGVQAFAMLRKDADPGRTAAQFDAILQNHISDEPFLKAFKLHMILQPLEDVHFNAAFDNDGIRKANRSVLYSLIGVAAFILLLAIANFASLSTAQSLQRSKEIGIRRILGASRFQLVIRSLTEAFMVITVSALIALLLVHSVINLFDNYLPEALSFHVLGIRNLLFTALIIVFVTLLSGMFPAVKLVRWEFNRTVLTEKNMGLTMGRALIVLQFSVSFLFIIAALVVGHQVRYMEDAKMGFNGADVFSLTNSDASPQQLQLFCQGAKSIPGVQAVTVQNHPPASTVTEMGPMQLDNRSDNKLDVYLQDGDQEFIRLYHIPLLAGHDLLPGDSLQGFIINDTYRKALGFRHPSDAIGHTISWLNYSSPIIGVAADFHTASLHTAIPPLVIARIAHLDNGVAMRIPTGSNRTLLRLELLWGKLVPGLPFNYTYFNDSISRLYEDDRRQSRLVNAATGVAIFISCIGLLGLILFIAERKKKDISIRKVLGARERDIIVLLNREFVVLLGTAFLIASPLAFLGMHRWLQEFAYRVGISWWIFAVAAIITLAITVATVSLSVIRAARVNPTKNLRSE